MDTVQIANFIANFIYQRYYKWEQRTSGEPVRTFDTLCSSFFQIPAAVLERLGLVERLDDSGREYKFVCEPCDFHATILAHQHGAYDLDVHVLALLALANRMPPCHPELLEQLIKAGLCEPVEFKTKIQPSFEIGGMKALGGEFPDYKVTWAAKCARYNALYRDWACLIHD